MKSKIFKIADNIYKVEEMPNNYITMGMKFENNVFISVAILASICGTSIDSSCRDKELFDNKLNECSKVFTTKFDNKLRQFIKNTLLTEKND